MTFLQLAITKHFAAYDTDAIIDVSLYSNGEIELHDGRRSVLYVYEYGTAWEDEVRPARPRKAILLKPITREDAAALHWDRSGCAPVLP